MTDTWSTPTQPLPPTWGIPPPSPPQPKPPLWRRPWVVITGCVLVGLTGLGILGSTMEPTTDVQQPQPTVTAPNTTPVTKAPATTATTLGAVAVPQTTDPPATTLSQSEQLQAWWALTEPDATSFEENAGEIGQLFVSDPYSVMADPSEANELLIRLQMDVQNLKAHGPVPVDTINQPWQKALRAYGKAFDLVYDGINSGDYDKVTRGAVLMNEGNTYMGQATEELTRFNTG